MYGGNQRTASLPQTPSRAHHRPAQGFEPRVARFGRDERALRADLAEAVLRDVAVERHVAREDRFVVAEQVFLIGARRNLFGHFSLRLRRRLLGESGRVRFACFDVTKHRSDRIGFPIPADT